MFDRIMDSLLNKPYRQEEFKKEKLQRRSVGLIHARLQLINFFYKKWIVLLVDSDNRLDGGSFF